jgi:hypothetical protein
MALATTTTGTPRIVASRWEPSIRVSVKACDEGGHGGPLAEQLGAQVYSPPIQVTRSAAGWHVVETWVVWPDCVPTVAAVADVIAIVPMAFVERWDEALKTVTSGHRYLALDRLLEIVRCARPINDAFDILYLGDFDGDTLRRLVVAATDQPPAPFCPAEP